MSPTDSGDAVDGLIHDAQTHLRPRGGRAVRVAREQGVRGRLARLELLLVRDDLKLEHLVARGHLQVELLRVHLAAADVGDADGDVRGEARLDGDVDGRMPPGDVY